MGPQVRQHWKARRAGWVVLGTLLLALVLLAAERNPGPRTAPGSFTPDALRRPPSRHVRRRAGAPRPPGHEPGRRSPAPRPGEPRHPPLRRHRRRLGRAYRPGTPPRRDRRPRRSAPEVQLRPVAGRWHVHRGRRPECGNPLHQRRSRPRRPVADVRSRPDRHPARHLFQHARPLHGHRPPPGLAPPGGRLRRPHVVPLGRSPDGRALQPRGHQRHLGRARGRVHQPERRRARRRARHAPGAISSRSDFTTLTPRQTRASISRCAPGTGRPTRTGRTPSRTS